MWNRNPHIWVLAFVVVLGLLLILAGAAGIGKVLLMLAGS